MRTLSRVQTAREHTYPGRTAHTTALRLAMLYMPAADAKLRKGSQAVHVSNNLLQWEGSVLDEERDIGH